MQYLASQLRCSKTLTYGKKSAFPFALIYDWHHDIGKRWQVITVDTIVEMVLMMMCLSFIGKKYNLSCTERCHCCAEPVLAKVRWLSCRWSVIVHSSALMKLCFRMADRTLQLLWCSLLLRILCTVYLVNAYQCFAHIITSMHEESFAYCVGSAGSTHYVVWIQLWLSCHCSGTLWYELH